MRNKVELLDNDIIYVQKIGDQTEQSLFELIGKINHLAAGLRAQKKPVLILSNASAEGKMDAKARKMAAKIGKDLAYDKSATFGSSEYLYNLRELMIIATQLNQKVANFKTEAEAVAWLLK